MPLGFPLGGVQVRNVGPQRHQLQGHRPADQFLLRMQNLEAAHELVGEPAARQADFLGGHILELLEERIGDFRSSVGEAVVRALGRVLDQLFAGHGEDARTNPPANIMVTSGWNNRAEKRDLKLQLDVFAIVVFLDPR